MVLYLAGSARSVMLHLLQKIGFKLKNALFMFISIFPLKVQRIWSQQNKAVKIKMSTISYFSCNLHNI